MSSIIMHICVSNIIKDELKLSNDFLAGSVLPDLKKLMGIDRNITHYLKYSVDEDGNVMHLPDLEKFIEDNTFRLSDPLVLGSYANLIEDKVWFEKFVGKYIKLHNEDLGLITLNKTGEVCKFEVFSKEMYSDYNNVNDVVISKYNMDLNIISKEIKDGLHDEALVSCLEKSLTINNNFKLSDERYFLTDDDLNDYINISKKEVIKKLKEII